MVTLSSHSRWPATLTAWLLFLLFRPVSDVNVFAAEGDDCAARLRIAGRLFANAQFKRCSTLVDSCLRSCDLTRPLKIEAWDLLGQSLVKQRDESLRERAREVIRELLKIEPSYSPREDAEQGYKNLVQRVRGELPVADLAPVPRVTSLDTVIHVNVKPAPTKQIEHLPTEPSEGNLWIWLAVGIVAVIGAVVVIAANQ